MKKQGNVVRVGFNRHEGITLIALIVTIIVLLILAGVSLNLVAGSNGILGRATSAVNATNLAKIKEELELKIAELQLDYYSDSSLQSSYATVNAYVKAKLNGIELSNGAEISCDDDGNLSYDGSPIGTLDTDGTITIDGEFNGGQIVARYKVTYNANGLIEAIGLPSSQKLENNSKVDTTATLTDPHGTPFLGWSTDKNATKAESNIIISGSNITLYAVWGDLTQSCNAVHPEKHIPTGFSHTEGTVDEGYVIKDDEENEFVWIPVANDEAYSKKLGTNNFYLEGSNKKTTSIEDGVKGDKLGIINILETTVEDSTTAEQSEYAVVKKAGGFWVGRYEAGVESKVHDTNEFGTDVDTSNEYWESNKKNITVKKGNEPVRYITQAKALEIANNWKSGNAESGTASFQSGLITGSQWDAMCKFIGWDVADSDCSSWGNYAFTVGQPYTGYHSENGEENWINSSITKESGFSILFPTGIFKTSLGRNTAQKNIYDVAGNVWEWTTEIAKYGEQYAIYRGGDAQHNGAQEIATHRYSTSYAVEFQNKLPIFNGCRFSFSALRGIVNF